MRYGKFTAAAALVIGSVGLGSAATQGSAPATPAAGDRVAVDEKSPGGPAPGGVVAAEELTFGYVFVPIVPYRTYDSRFNFPGRISHDEEQIFTVLTDEDDFPMIPADAAAVTYNITVTGTSGGPGYLAIYPADSFWPGNASVNWSADGTTVGNGGTTAIGFWTTDGEIAVLMGSVPGASTDYIIDITGYYVLLQP